MLIVGLLAVSQLGVAHAGGERAARWRNARRGIGALLTSVVPRASRIEEHATTASTVALAAADFGSPRLFTALSAVGGPVMVATSVKDSVDRVRDRLRARGPGARLSLRDLRDPAHLDNLSGVAWGAEMPVWAASSWPRFAGLARAAAAIGTAGAVCQLGFGCAQIRSGLREGDGWQVAAGVTNIVGAVGWAGAELSGHPAFTAMFLGSMGVTTAIDNREGIGRAFARAKRGLSAIGRRARSAACRVGGCISEVFGRGAPDPVAAAAAQLR